MATGPVKGRGAVGPEKGPRAVAVAVEKDAAVARARGLAVLGKTAPVARRVRHDSPSDGRNAADHR
ncbi:hypothetical protein [Desulfosarcina ovata]|uniref:hypothetical protein n=1 Tax=Desulfosarcina ovata TaxID=83564 RepID=UPI0012D2F9D5|nr:hypothetical protein [Desulfosarcina ovata]